MDQFDQSGGQRRAQAQEWGRVALQSGQRGRRVGLGLERHPSGEALVEHEPERVEVGAAVESPAADLFG